jgi:hypothetical protein
MRPSVQSVKSVILHPAHACAPGGLLFHADAPVDVAIRLRWNKIENHGLHGLHGLSRFGEAA